MKIEIIKKIDSSKGQVFVIDSNQFEVDRQLFKPKKEFQARVIQLILSELIGDHTLSHLENGAPYLKDYPYNISISHCDNLFAIYLSKIIDVGVDIETIKKDLNKVKAYFLNKNEINNAWSLKELYLIWCMKEAIFKLERGKINDLANEVTISSYTANQVFYSYNSEEKSLNYFYRDNWILTYT